MKTSILKKTVFSIFRKYGLSKNDSKLSTDALINAELVGAHSHGLSRLKMYCDRIQKKLINPKPKINRNLFLILMQIIVLASLLLTLQ